MTNITKYQPNKLNDSDRAFVEQRTEEIKTLLRRSAEDIVTVGIKLNEVKAKLGHGQFQSWLDQEFQWTDRTARNFMNVATRFKSENFSDLYVEPSALYLLAAPSTPKEVAEEAVKRAKSGEKITHAAAKQIIDAHKPKPDPKPASAPAPDPELADPAVDPWLRHAEEIGVAVPADETPDSSEAADEAANDAPTGAASIQLSEEEIEAAMNMRFDMFYLKMTQKYPGKHIFVSPESSPQIWVALHGQTVAKRLHTRTIPVNIDIAPREQVQLTCVKLFVRDDAEARALEAIIGPLERYIDSSPHIAQASLQMGDFTPWQGVAPGAPKPGLPLSPPADAEAVAWSPDPAPIAAQPALPTSALDLALNYIVDTYEVMNALLLEAINDPSDPAAQAVARATGRALEKTLGLVVDCIDDDRNHLPELESDMEAIRKLEHAAPAPTEVPAPERPAGSLLRTFGDALALTVDLLNTVEQTNAAAKHLPRSEEDEPQFGFLSRTVEFGVMPARDKLRTYQDRPGMIAEIRDRLAAAQTVQELADVNKLINALSVGSPALDTIVHELNLASAAAYKRVSDAESEAA